MKESLLILTEKIMSTTIVTLTIMLTIMTKMLNTAKLLRYWKMIVIKDPEIQIPPMNSLMELSIRTLKINLPKNVKKTEANLLKGRRDRENKGRLLNLVFFTLNLRIHYIHIPTGFFFQFDGLGKFIICLLYTSRCV